MSKRLMTIENCKECPDSTFGYLMGRKRICARMFPDECTCPEKGTPDWCKLPEVPEEREYYHEYGQAKDFADGWNSCIDAITGEEEE